MEYHVAKDPAHKNCVHRYSWRVEIVASSWALQSSELGTELTSSELLSLIPSSKKMDLPQLYLQGTPTEPASLRVPVLVTEEGMFFFKPYFLPIRAACATVKSANSSQIFMFSIHLLHTHKVPNIWDLNEIRKNPHTVQGYTGVSSSLKSTHAVFI